MTQIFCEEGGVTLADEARDVSVGEGNTQEGSQHLTVHEDPDTVGPGSIATFWDRRGAFGKRGRRLKLNGHVQ